MVDPSENLRQGRKSLRVCVRSDPTTKERTRYVGRGCGGARWYWRAFTRGIRLLWHGPLPLPFAVPAVNSSYDVHDG